MEKVRLRIKVAHEAKGVLEKVCESSGKDKNEMLDTILCESLPFLWQEVLKHGWCRYSKRYPSQQQKLDEAVVASRVSSRTSFWISFSAKEELQNRASQSGYYMGEIVSLLLMNYEQIILLSRMDGDHRRKIVAAYQKKVIAAHRRIKSEIDSMRREMEMIQFLYFTPEKSPAYSFLRMLFSASSELSLFDKKYSNRKKKYSRRKIRLLKERMREKGFAV